eukprot:382482-Hanusia_phi.AAC.1
MCRQCRSARQVAQSEPGSGSPAAADYRRILMIGIGPRLLRLRFRPHCRAARSHARMVIVSYVVYTHGRGMGVSSTVN